MIKETQKTEYEPINMEEVLKKPFRIISMADALNDVIPVEWSEDVLSGKKKVFLDVPRGKAHV